MDKGPVDVFDDVASMHQKFGHSAMFDSMDDRLRWELLRFRVRFLEEEMTELRLSRTPEGVVDALIDLIVVAVGTLDCMGVDGSQAWIEVHRANMSKEAGVNPSRDNPLGLPDLVKPAG